MKVPFVLLMMTLTPPAFATEVTDTPPAATVVAPEKNADTPEYPRNTFSAELLGRGLLGSVNYDYALTDELSLGLGFSHYSISSLDSNLKATIVPVYANYYVLGKKKNRMFATAGADFIMASGHSGSDAKIDGSGVAGVLGLGYEHRTDGGFTFRVAPYALVGKTSGGWIGVTFGYAI